MRSGSIEGQLDMPENTFFYAGLDIGGTTVKSILVNGDGDQVGEMVEVRSNVKAGYEATFNQLELALEELAKGASIERNAIRGIGLDVPAPSSDGVIWAQANLSSDWLGTNIRDQFDFINQVGDFDNVDITILDVVKENIVAVLKTVVHQKTLEAIVRTDLFTGLKSEEYLYGEGKKIIDKYTISTVCMFKITNLPQINEQNSRKLGDKVCISGRSIGDINVQIILEKLGGGGHITLAGAQVEGMSIEEVKNLLIEKINEYFSETAN